MSLQTNPPYHPAQPAQTNPTAPIWRRPALQRPLQHQRRFQHHQLETPPAIASSARAPRRVATRRARWRRCPAGAATRIRRRRTAVPPSSSRLRQRRSPAKRRRVRLLLRGMPRTSRFSCARALARVGRRFAFDGRQECCPG